MLLAICTTQVKKRVKKEIFLKKQKNKVMKNLLQGIRTRTLKISEN